MEEEIIIITKEGKRLPVNKGSSFSGYDLIQILNKKGNNGSYSLEPGGQVEWSSFPYKSLIDLGKAQKEHKEALDKVISQNNLKVISYGVEPFFLAEEVDIINDLKYELMNKSMEKNGSMGKWMMRNTASVQINIDFVNEKELEEIVYVADCVNPISAYLFSNSPLINGEKVKNKNIRNIIWENTDNVRCRNLIDHGIIEPKNLINRYIDYLGVVPGIFQIDKDGKVESTNGTLLDRLENLNKFDRLKDEDIKCALHQIFTNVRLKNLIEIRGADRPPIGYEMAPVSFWTGILTVESVRSEIFKEVISWSYEDRIKFNNASLSLDDSAITVKNRKYSYWNNWLGELAIIGLKERGMEEEILFEHFFDNVKSKGPFSLQLQ
jgi:glutamate--cysteine ligase